jgi:hypothetical protein
VRLPERGAYLVREAPSGRSPAAAGTRYATVRAPGVAAAFADYGAIGVAAGGARRRERDASDLDVAYHLCFSSPAM